MAGATAASARPLEFAAFKAAIDPLVAAAVSRRLDDCQKLNLDSAVMDLITYGANLALAGGKRIRPYVAFLSYASSNGAADQEVMPALVGLELFHLFALIHDDWMDHGTTRHGIACMHCYAAEALAKSGARASDEVGAAQAILVGDMVFNWSAQQLLEHVPPAQLRQVLALFHGMINEVVAGQMLDIDTMARERVPAAAVARKTELKSAWYTFVNPIKIGAALAGVDGTSLAESLGTSLGLAFQLQDDLLDIVGSSAAMGKGVLSDLHEHQHTFFTQHIFEQGTPEQQAELQGYLGRGLSEQESQQAIKLFHDSGAIAAGRELIASYYGKARQQVASLLPNSPIAPAWLSFIDSLEKRSM